ncbi:MULTISPECIES: hydroxymethylglutaryl-CoA reductase, degradative [Dietzia]|uniref:3-hydroxy-3-methylglutaryl coenzyme A reductase n=2 Tax=Dietzia TaxID=37914 RepID=A0AAW5QAB3_9ACTN|nr:MULTISPECIES: hydroxymethylglutaryl-CoA reductase, degradative [Dietzia]MCT1863377.1 hydroxymethylglutaryl-CoA reductase, degradative [Dietzia cinnamea]MCT2029404.1 hydroxymethylglutaryl-CoA reductase, degradative [Dietzia cinnamea]MCT2033099.1 hydroxymethylglutaryl-CoA reductase, degradative [Dietzia cinnamea]MCT2061110.1 hydroxymethylglutaryl-CoA reductase, degradative [Dietzia cinnamea]MCT2076507.1 hydroxymethylglutaryl-CoA reductase, degradative [Dietzia cinnamea]
MTDDMVNSRIPGLKDLTLDERREIVAANSPLDADDFGAWDPATALTLEQADHMIENVVGVLPIPIGFAANFTINGRDVLVPMATEEPSVVAAASNAARIARASGGFTTSSSAPIMRAQVQIVNVADPQAARLRLFEARDELIAAANAQDPMLVSLGGGVRDIDVQLVEAASQTYVVLHLIVDVRDAMGANAVNTMAEAIAARVGELAQGRPVLRILSNKADLRVARARAVFSAEQLGGEEIVDDIVHAAALANADPYRAATHNKGATNGIIAVVLATGNDTRAVEAGIHSHAVREGRYTALTRFEKDASGDLVASLEVPMAVGLVGGATKVHPGAQKAVKMLDVATASELAEVIVAVGLAQNVAGLRVLATEGVQRGHMSLHARNVAVSAGAVTPEEITEVAEKMVSEKAVRAERAAEILGEVRGDGK